MKSSKKSRSSRRADHERMVERVSSFSYLRHIDDRFKDKLIKKCAETRKPCSCHMCGNPRKYNKGQSKKTLAELRFEQE